MSSRYVGEPTIPENGIEDLINRTESLLKDVHASPDLDGEAKTWLVDRLREIRDALQGARVVGYQSGDRVFTGIVGSAVRERSIFTRIKDSTVGPALMGILTALNLAVTTAVGVNQLTGGPPDPAQAQIVVQQIMELPAASTASADIEGHGR